MLSFPRGVLPAALALGLGLALAVAPIAAAVPPAPTAKGGISGTVTYAGNEGESRHAVTMDAAACGEPGVDIPAGDLLVADGRLAGVVVFLPDEPAAHEPPAEGSPAPVGADGPPPVTEVANIRCAFVPRVSVGVLGGRLRIRNADPVLHGARLTDEATGRPVMNLSLPLQGQAIDKPLRRAGLMRLGCDVHVWMRGFVFVARAGRAVVTGPDGRFALEGLPAGRHVVAFWHERLGERRAEIVVAPGKSATLDLAY